MELRIQFESSYRILNVSERRFRPVIIMKKAFTLIELLVVIAIIAILAAILFPVFAQAKAAAKKTACLSNVKQMGTSAQIYMADSDDLFPTTYAPMVRFGEYSYDTFMPVGNWVTGLTVDDQNAVNTFFANNLQPYMKNIDMFFSSGATRVASVGTMRLGQQAPPNIPGISYSMNGLLNAWSSTAVASPSTLPAFWTMFGRRAIAGMGYVSPYLFCPNPAAPCSYVPPTASCSPSINGQWSGTNPNNAVGWDLHGGGATYSFADSSAKFRRNGSLTNTQTDPRVDPLTNYRQTGGPDGWYDRWGCHSYLFRPDFDLANPDPAAIY